MSSTPVGQPRDTQLDSLAALVYTSNAGKAIRVASGATSFELADVSKPLTDGGSSLGSTSLQWANLYGASGFTINIGNGNAVVTHSSGIFTVSTGDFRVTTAGTNSASAVTVGGTQTLANKTLTAPTMTGRTQLAALDYGTITDDGNSGTSKTIDFSAKNIHKVTLTGNCTFTFTAPAGSTSIALKCIANGTGGYTLTWPGSVVWNGGVAPPALAASEVQIIAGIFDGTNYYLDFTPSSLSTSVVSVADAAGDTTCWPMLARAVTGDQIASSDTGLSYNSTTHALTATTFIGALTGNASTVTTNANLTGPVTSAGNATTIAAGVVTEAMQVLADNTTNNVSTSKHGYAPKGDGDTSKFLNANGAYSSPSGSGTVTATGGSLTANAVVLGAGTTDTKAVAGIVTDGTSALTLGVAGTSVGTVLFKNATSGTITLSPPTGALGTVTVSLPASTDTLVGKATTDVLTNKVLTSATITTSLVTTTDDGAALGSTSKQFSDLFLASGGVINWSNGNATITHSSGLLTLNVPVTVGTSNAVTLGTVELGHASDTTLARSSAGVLSVEGVVVPTISSTNTFTNKRRTFRRDSSQATHATPTTNTDNCDIKSMTAQAAAITSFTTNLSGSPVHGDFLLIEITDDGTARAITWGASFVATTVALPTMTVISTLLRVLFQWDATASKWCCVGAA